MYLLYLVDCLGAHIEVEKQQQRKDQSERQITIRGTTDAIRQAMAMIQGLIDDTDAAVNDIINKVLLQL